MTNEKFTIIKREANFKAKKSSLQYIAKFYYYNKDVFLLKFSPN